MTERFYSSQGFALRGEFLSQRWERNQRIAGGRLQRSTVPVLLVALPPVPHYGRRPTEKFSNVSGARNQECLGAFPSGPTGALGL